MVIMNSSIARGRVRTTTATTESRNMAAILEIGWQPWFNMYFFDIGHPCYDQLTPVKTRYPLISITWSHRGLKCTAHRGHVVFWSWPLTKCWFLIGPRAHVRLTCWKWGRIVQKRVNANPGLKVNWIITFSSIHFFCCFVLCIWWLLKLKTEGQTIYRKPHCKVRKLKSKFYLFLD